MTRLRDRSIRAGRLWRASALALASALIAIVGLVPTTASAITRSDVLTRAQSWVKKKVRYSQRSYFMGYRRDCSGFVSMAWRLGRSYTSGTLHAIARRVPLSQLQPGDAVHTPGHVAIFVRWHNKARGLYVAMEQTTWGQSTAHHVRKLGGHATALRYRHITEPVRVAGTDDTYSTVAAAPAPAAATTETSGSVFPASLGLLASSSIETTISNFATEFIALFELPSLAPTSAAGAQRLALVPLY